MSQRVQALLHRLAAFCLAVVLFLPAGLALQLAAVDTCSCGMKSGCFCKMMAPRGGAQGAHCSTKAAGRGHCGMKAPSRSGDTPMPVSFDLRGWLRAGQSREAAPDPEPSGRVTPLGCPLVQARSQAPEIPPPEPFQTA